MPTMFSCPVRFTARLVEEPRDDVRVRRHRLVQELHRDAAADDRVFGEVHGAYAAAAEKGFKI